MAYILWNTGEKSLINTWLGGYGGNNAYSATYNTPGDKLYVGLGARTIGVGGSAEDKAVPNGSDTTNSLAEIGQTKGAGYARQELLRNGVTAGGWPEATKVGTSCQSTHPQVQFSFTDAPNLNGATLWFVALTSFSPDASTGGSPSRLDDCLFGADLAQTRNFSAGDSERITITYRQT